MLNIVKRIFRVNKKYEESAKYPSVAILEDNDTKIALIQTLITVGSEAVNPSLTPNKKNGKKTHIFYTYNFTYILFILGL